MNERLAPSPRFDRFFETTSELLAVLDATGRFVSTNDAFRVVLGYTPEVLAGRGLLEIVLSEGEASVRGAFDAIAKGGSACVEATVRHRDRSPRAVAFSLRHVPEDNATYFVGREVAGGPGADEAARRSALLLGQTQALARVGGWEIDCATMQLFWTDETYRLHEVPIDYVPSVETAIAFYAPEAIPIISAAVEACMTNGEPFDDELQILTYTKRRLWVRAAGSASFENGKVARIFGAFQDIDEKKRRELELQEKLQIIEHQRSTIHSMSAPIIQVWDGVLALPVVGMLDEARASDMTERLLEAVVSLAATQVILDLTGVDSVDDATADYLVRIIRATQLLGAQSIITGIRPAVAQTLVMLGADLGNTVMLANLRDAIKAAMRSGKAAPVRR
jgi:rsbT co-antagonist protein RsbR